MAETIIQPNAAGTVVTATKQYHVENRFECIRKSRHTCYGTVF